MEKTQNITEKMKYVVATGAAAIFMAAAYYLPAETFLGFFAAVLFVIPMGFFVYMIQQYAKGDDDKKGNESE